jgi:hypothetical protein
VVFKLSLSVFLICSVMMMGHGFATDPIGSSIDCTDISVNYGEDATLTQQEKLEQMDRALFDSLNKFELCQSAKNSQAASGAGAQAGGGGGGASGAEQAGSEGGTQDEGQTGSQGDMQAMKSTAGSGMSGTDAPKPPSPAPDVNEGDVNPTDEQINQSTMDGTQAGGKLPDDIPAAANDDALAAQIRYAAENEPDPKKKAQLWDEYRKYKGLPSKK